MEMLEGIIERTRAYIRQTHMRMRDYGKSTYSKEEIKLKTEKVNRATYESQLGYHLKAF
jgi:hypothetical protein